MTETADPPSASAMASCQTRRAAGTPRFSTMMQMAGLLPSFIGWPGNGVYWELTLYAVRDGIYLIRRHGTLRQVSPRQAHSPPDSIHLLPPQKLNELVGNCSFVAATSRSELFNREPRPPPAGATPPSPRPARFYPSAPAAKIERTRRKLLVCRRDI